MSTQDLPVVEISDGCYSMRIRSDGMVDADHFLAQLGIDFQTFIQTPEGQQIMNDTARESGLPATSCDGETPVVVQFPKPDTPPPTYDALERTQQQAQAEAELDQIFAEYNERVRRRRT